MQKALREVGDAYDHSAYLYNLMNKLYFLGRDNRFRSILANRLKLKPGYRVLNLCCGTDLDFPFLRQKIQAQGMLVGVDFSRKMLQQATKNVGSDGACLIKADVAHLPFRDNSVDAILVSFCLKITPAYKTAIEESARVLKPVGRMGVLANSTPSGLFRLPGIIITTVISSMAKINFEVSLEKPLSEKFKIVENKRMYGGSVQVFLAAETKKCSSVNEI